MASRKPFNKDHRLADVANTFIPQDATGTPVVSPLTAGTHTLLVHKTATEFIAKANGTNTVTIKREGDTGVYTLRTGEREAFPVAGLNDDGATFINELTVVVAASTTLDFYFACLTPNGV